MIINTEVWVPVKLLRKRVVIQVLLRSHEQGIEIANRKVNSLLLAPTRSLKRLQTDMTAQSLLLEP